MTLYKATVRGTLNGAEEFQFGFHFTQPTLSAAGPGANAENVRDAFSDAWDTLYGSQTMQSIFSTTTVFSSVVVHELDDETYVVTDSGEAGFTSIAGTSANPSMPANVAVCVSLLTGNPGRSKRGRLYYPPLQRDILATGGLIPSVTQTTIATFTRDWFEGINGFLTGERVVVLSRALGDTFIVSQLKVGQVFDSQERRRRSLPDIGVTLDVDVA